MAKRNRRLSMGKAAEILRLKNESGLSYEKIAISCSVSKSTVSEVVRRFAESGQSWPLPEGTTEEKLERMLYPDKFREKQVKAPLNLPYIHNELRRKSVTLQLLWEEYKADHPDGYQYSYFCEIYYNWRQKLDVVLKQHYPYGKFMEVDFAGQTVFIKNAETGELREAQIFIAVMPATGYFFAYAVYSQDMYNWIDLHIKAFDFFGGVPEILVPDNLKSSTNKTCRYEPDINKTYLEFAVYYGTAIIPARPRKPRDKSSAENAVLIAERWILARLRNITFFCIEDLNTSIEKILIDCNNKPFQKIEGCRKELFEAEEKHLLKPLPATPYEYATWKKVTVNIDCHAEIEKCYYSAPYQLVKEKLEARITNRMVELFYKNNRVASHPKGIRKGEYKTNIEHLPKSHQKHLEWTPSRIINWAKKTGDNTAAMVKELFEAKQHPEQAYRACLGLLRLSDKYTPERLENACKRAIKYRAISYQSVKSILEKGLDKEPLEEVNEYYPLQHQNIRGAEYYKEEKKC